MPKFGSAGAAIKGLRRLAQGRLPGQLIIQYSDACNAACPQCELRASARFKRARIDHDVMKRMIDAAAQNGVQALSFTGGEPFLYSDDLFELIDYAGRVGIRFTRTGTNAFFLRNPGKPGWEARVRGIAERMAATSLYTFWISLDSSDPDVHEEMRGLPGVVRGIEKALPIFAEYGIYPSVNLGVNRNTGGRWASLAPDCGRPLEPEQFYGLFRKSFARFYQFVTNMGFTITNACYPMSIETSGAEDLGSVYGASSADFVVSFTAQEKTLLFQAMLDTIPEFSGQIRVFSPLCSLYALAERYAGRPDPGYACPGGIDYFFVEAQRADTYPCGFRAHENLGKFWELDPALGKQTPACTACDWECWRDPANLFGPLLELRRAPLSLLRRFRRHPQFAALWQRDLRYYAACAFFSCRTAPDYARLRRFQNDPGEPPRRPHPAVTA